MKVTFDSSDFQSALETFQQQTGATKQFCGCESLLMLPATLGEGQIRSASLRAGLDLLFKNTC